MKKYLLIFIVLILFLPAGMLYGQHENFHISAAINGGLYIPNGKFGESYKSGINAGAEVQYGNKDKGAWFTLQYYSFEFKGSTRSDITDYSFTNESNSSITEFSAGLRYFFGEPNAKGFIEGGGGFTARRRNAYTENYKQDGIPYTRRVEYSTQNKFWLIPGAGAQFKLNRNFDLFVKGRLFISMNTGKFVTFSGLYSGVRYTFK